MKKAYIFGALLLAGLLVLLFFIPAERPPEAAGFRGMPWEVAVDDAGNTTVLGIRPGHTTLAEVRQWLGNEVEVAIIAAPEEPGSLEAYYAQVVMGPLLGRLVLTLDDVQDNILAMRDRAVKAEYMESMTRKIYLSAADLELANTLPIQAVTLIPNANLDQATIVQRFGEPAERITVSDTQVHLLYPKYGLDILYDAKGKEVLQYVHPGRFQALHAPLRQIQPSP